MSARALQRVVVRMLYDPALVAAVYADASAALADVPLTPAERRWLVAPDRRRWAADPLRRTRGLQALLEEYPVSAALAAPGDVARLDRFFSAAAFHDCIQHRGSLADAFGAWLADGRGPVVGALAGLERGIARVRRAPPPSPCTAAGERWQTTPWVVALTPPQGTLAAWQRARAALNRHPDGPVAALLDPAWAPVPSPTLGDGREGLIVERDAAGDVGAGECPTALADLLRRLETPHETAGLLSALEALGADADEAPGVIASLVEDGLLTAG